MRSNTNRSDLGNTSGSDMSNSSAVFGGKNCTNDSSVQVAIRVRPFLPIEIGNTSCVDVLSSNLNRGSDGAKTHDMIRIGGEEGRTYIFDAAFDPTATQRQVFTSAILPRIEACLDGYNATILAYGQTGSGKTFTVLGPGNADSFEDDIEQEQGEFNEEGLNITDSSNERTGHNKKTHSQAGVIPRALRELFCRLEQRRNSYNNKMNEEQSGLIKENNDVRSSQNKANEHQTPQPAFEYDVRVQFLELYGEEIRDLLSSSTLSKLSIRDGGQGLEPEVIGASEVKVTSAEEALLCLTRGMLRRVTASTAMNAESSRSHAIMTMVIEQTVIEDSSGHIESKRSKLHFVDLAGSERQKRSMAEGKRLKEGIDINKGLLVLGNVISALGDPKKSGKSFVPYRDSKLTRLLKGSLGGNHKTLMIACVSPSSSNMEESLNCLRYANRAKNIQNNAVVNIDAESRLVAELRVQVQELASDFLKERSGKETSGGMFPNTILQSLANGNDSSGIKLTGLSSSSTNTVVKRKTLVEMKEDSQLPFDTEATHGLKNFTNNGIAGNDQGESCLTEENLELTQLRDSLKRAKDDLFSKSEEIFSAKAEIEFLSIHSNKISNDHDNIQISDLETAKTIENKGSEYRSVFVEKIASFQREIESLKDELSRAKASSSSCMMDTDDVDYHLGKNENIEQERNNLSNLQNKSLSSELDPEVSQASTQLAYDEAIAEQKDMESLTNKFLQLDPDYSEMNPEPEDRNAGEDNSDKTSEVEPERFHKREKQLNSNWMELSRSIAAKKDLIDRLAENQTKYETMRLFYEDKLQQMECQLQERETEREWLATELKKYEKDSQNFKDLNTALTAKDIHISNLKKRQKDLTNLTKISSRNQNTLAQLKDDLLNMKQQKANLQRQMVKEKKDHNIILKELRKAGISKDREALRSKKELLKMGLEKENMGKKAKSQIGELKKLRVKYKDAEKRLRIQTLKRSVMKKVGIDYVMIGRKKSKNKKMSASNLKDRKVRLINDVKEVDTDQIREFLDEKVANITMKEAVVDKLALEWEEHFELTTRKEEMMNSIDHCEKDNISEELETLDIQIQYKQEQIRKLTMQLGNRPKLEKSSIEEGSLHEDLNFTKICASVTPLAASKLAAKVLFGMVVNERRRVDALVRTASALDQKTIDANNLIESKEAALHSLMDEGRYERAAMSQSHQEQILSLMALVEHEQQKSGIENLKDADETKIEEDSIKKLKSSSPLSSDSMVLRFANERIDALEQHLSELEGERVAKEMYKSKEVKLRKEMRQRNKECLELQNDLDSFKSCLCQIRDSLYKRTFDPELIVQSRTKNSLGCNKIDIHSIEDNHAASHEDSNLNAELLDLIEHSLHPPDQTSSKKKGNNNTHSSLGKKIRYDSSHAATKNIKSRIEMMQNSENEIEEELPEWADSIMEDLEIIAAGHVPPSMKYNNNKRHHRNGSITGNRKSNNGSRYAKSDVFERLTDPSNFTGIQKSTFCDSSVASKQLSYRKKMHNGKKSSEKQVISDVPSFVVSLAGRKKRDSESNSSIATLIESPQKLDDSNESIDRETSKSPIIQKKSNRSVFDRLQSPSNYTGTQKTAHNTTKGRQIDSKLNHDERIDHYLDGSSLNATSSLSNDQTPKSVYSSSTVDEYAQQNVFQRLQKTFTKSYTLKDQTAQYPSSSDDSSIYVG